MLLALGSRVRLSDHLDDECSNIMAQALLPSFIFDRLDPGTSGGGSRQTDELDGPEAADSGPPLTVVSPAIEPQYDAASIQVFCSR